jgi:predicted DNA-binding transcriptional regulator YafY
MAKRPDTLETVRITLELLRRIPRNGKISGPDLLKQLQDAGFNRDIRTIERHLKSLSASDLFDIERDDRNKPFGYKWKERAKGLALPVLSEQESLLLTLAEKYLQSLLPAALMKSMEGFFSQARNNLGQQSNSKREREWLSKVRVVSINQPLLPPKIIPGVFDAVSNALYANRWLNLEYKNAAGKNTKAEVMPLGLAQQGPRLYLVCRYKGYDNERSLALHRIVSAEASTLTFDRPKEFNLQQYDDDGRFGFGDGKKIRLTFRIEKEAGFHLLESPLSTDQRVKEIGDQFEISATVVDTAQLEWWILGFGERVNNVRRDPVPSI